ncbi:eukaryotic translation release factor [Mycena filopes]|nr:eukaryotic translation release factor [Mycena filopes]
MSHMDASEQRKLIQSLESAKGAGSSSLITLILSPDDELSRAASMLTQQYITAASVKTRASRLPVLAAITMAQQRLKLYEARLPPNGLVLLVGTSLTDEGKETKVAFDFEPHRPFEASVYRCGNRFYTEELAALFESGPGDDVVVDSAPTVK